MEFPRDIIVGHNAIEEIVDLSLKVNLRKHPLVVHDRKTKELAGNRISEILSGADYTVDDIVVEEATMKEVTRVQNHATKWGVEYLIAVGGGSVIDITKLASFSYGVPFISVPTAASHDGIASPQASIKEKVGSVSKQARSPVAILGDTAVISKAPYRMLASGCADVISNMTAILDWKLAWRLKREYYSTFAVAMAKTAADLIIENAEYIKPSIEESSWIAVKSMIVSGVAMSIANSSRPASGAEHMFSHALDRIVPGKAMHGEQCGVGSILMMYLHGGDWQSIQRALKLIGAPITAQEMNMTREDIVNALLMAQKIRPQRYTVLGADGISPDAAEHLVKATGVA